MVGSSSLESACKKWRYRKRSIAGDDMVLSLSENSGENSDGYYMLLVNKFLGPNMFRHTHMKPPDLIIKTSTRAW